MYLSDHLKFRIVAMFEKSLLHAECVGTLCCSWRNITVVHELPQKMRVGGVAKRPMKSV
jgi:hypothetical protein